MSQLFASRGQSTGVLASPSVLPVNIQGWFLLGLVWSHCPRDSQESSPGLQFESINSFFFFLSIYLNWRLITLQYCSGFCHTLIWISHRCTCVPHPEPPSHLPPHHIPQGHPSAPALSTLSHALNLDWRSISHIHVKYAYTYYIQCGRPGFDPWVGKFPWRRKWQPTPVFLLGKSHGPTSPVGYSPWSRKESDTTERLHFIHIHIGNIHVSVLFSQIIPSSPFPTESKSLFFTSVPFLLSCI